MLIADNQTLIATIRQQATHVCQAMYDELKGVTHISRIDAIHLKYTEKVISNLPPSLVEEIGRLTHDLDHIRLGKQPRPPVYGIVLDELLELLLKLSEVAFFNQKNGEFKTFLDYLEAEASRIPWFDPADELWCNRLSEKDEISLKSRFATAGRLQDYLDGDTEL